MMATVSFAKRESRLNPGIQAPRKTTRFLEILKRSLLGIESAPKAAIPKRVLRSAIKQTIENRKLAMLNKLNKRRGGFTLVEIMIVVAIIALLAAIAVPGFLRARKRSQASRILNDLRMIDAAVDQYAIETNKKSNDVVGTADWTNYLKKGSSLFLSGGSILGSAYGSQTVDTIPQVPSADYAALSDVAGTGFWSPYGP